MNSRFRRSHRFDDRIDPHWRRRGGRRGPPATAGLVLITLGVLFLLDRLNILEARSIIRVFWPLLIVGWGAARFVFGRGGERFVGVVAVAVGAVLLGNQLFGWNVSWALVWPVLLIAIGVKIFVRGCGWSRLPPAPPFRPPNTADAMGADTEPIDASNGASMMREFAVMGHVERRNVSQTFRGAQLTAVMGGVEIDLRECRMAGDEVRVDIFIVMGAVEFRIPRDWTVESRASFVMAVLEDRSEPPVEASSKRFVIHGSAFMGSIDVKN